MAAITTSHKALTVNQTAALSTYVREHAEAVGEARAYMAQHDGKRDYSTHEDELLTAVRDTWRAFMECAESLHYVQTVR